MRPLAPRVRSIACAGALGLVALASGCTDPDGRYDDFLERTADLRAPDSGAITPGERFDFSGRYLVALSITLAPGQPILLAADVGVAEDLASIDLAFQPLATDLDEAPRSEVGDALEVDAVPYAEDGSFEVDFGEVTVPARANPISGSDIVATVAIAGTAHEATDDRAMLFCGDASGMVRVPLALDLAGSTFGAVPAESFEGVEPLLRCP